MCTMIKDTLRPQWLTESHGGITARDYPTESDYAVIWQQHIQDLYYGLYNRVLLRTMLWDHST